MDVAANGYADPRALLGTTVPKVWSVAPHRSLFGDVVLVAFLLAAKKLLAGLVVAALAGIGALFKRKNTNT